MQGRRYSAESESRCRAGYHKEGDTFLVADICPPLCHELWNIIYPYVFALQNGANLDYSTTHSCQFDAKYPDGGRVCIHGKVIE